MSQSPASTGAAAELPTWMRWGGAGLTAMLAVLFLVLLAQMRQQSERLQTLQDRVQTLENARDLERTSALEEQLRSTVQRLQALEGLEQRLQRLSAEQDALKQQLRAGSAPNLEPLGSQDSAPIRPGHTMPPPPILPGQQ